MDFARSGLGRIAGSLTAASVARGDFSHASRATASSSIFSITWPMAKGVSSRWGGSTRRKSTDYRAAARDRTTELSKLYRSGVSDIHAYVEQQRIEVEQQQAQAALMRQAEQETAADALTNAERFSLRAALTTSPVPHIRAPPGWHSSTDVNIPTAGQHRVLIHPHGTPAKHGPAAMFDRCRAPLRPTCPSAY